MRNEKRPLAGTEASTSLTANKAMTASKSQQHGLLKKQTVVTLFTAFGTYSFASTCQWHDRKKELP